MTPDRPDERSAIVTGGSSGIGLAGAHALARAGFRLTLIGRRPDALADAVDLLAEDSTAAAVRTFAVDLAEADAARRVIDDHVRAFGGLDALVAAAGAWELTATADLSAATWDRTASVHVRSVALMAAAAAPHLERAGKGRIVLISSVNAFASEPASIAYSAAKAAVVSLARTLAVDLAAAGVSVNAVAPGWIDTPMTAAEVAATSVERMRRVNPLGRFGTADEVAEVIRWLVVDAPPFLTGSTLIVDGGQTASAAIP